MISLPIWVFVLIAVFAVIGVADRVFMPSVKWFFRSRANRAIEELNTRLHMRIQPFKLTKRQALIDQLLFDEAVTREIDAEAERSGKPREVVAAKAARYAREIVPHFSAYAYFNIGTRAARWLSTLVYRVRLGYSDDDALKNVDPDATVVFVMNHRSNMDYVLVTYMAAASASLSYAVGEWARIWLLQSLIKAMGAYFVRRDSGNELYRKVLSSYVRLATRQGVTQAVFPEGGLSRDGKLRDPKLGLLSYIVCDFSPGNQRDVVFVPVGVNYDRVIEDRILTAHAEREITGRSFRTSITGIIGFISKSIKLRLQGRLYRFGYACVSFGTPVSLTKWLESEKTDLRGGEEVDKRACIEKLGKELMSSIGAAVPVLPVSAVATVFLHSKARWMGELEVKSLTFDLIGELEKANAHIYIPRKDRDYAVSAGLRMLTLRRLVKERNGLYRMNQTENNLLAYYANSIGHFLKKEK